MTTLLLTALAAAAVGALGAGPPRRARAAEGDSAVLTIRVNVPAYRMDVRDGDSTWTYRVAVGQPKYPTPIGHYRVLQVIWNPWWVPPPSDWAKKEKVTPPGPDNPMGRVKLRFVELVFLHGTPMEGSLGSAASHACVRMANADAIALARRVHRRAIPDVPESVVDDAVADSTRTRWFDVEGFVSVEMRYDVAELYHDSLWVHRDIYGMRERPIRDAAALALAEAGVDTLQVNRARLDSLVRAARRRSAGAPVSALLRR